MASANSKQSEKEYLRRSAGGEWEASKPFPPPGQSATDEHAQHLLDFAVLLRVLTPAPSELLLDLGAGSCYVGLVARYGVQTVAVDIAFDMLRVGQAVGIGEGPGDRRHGAPFAPTTASRKPVANAFTMCRIPEALREIKRVLAPDGVAFFSEPGIGHASHPTSIAASPQLWVLENEIVIRQFMDACLAAGFADVRLHPISHRSVIRARSAAMAGVAHVHAQQAAGPCHSQDVAGRAGMAGLQQDRCLIRRSICHSVITRAAASHRDSIR